MADIETTTFSIDLRDERLWKGDRPVPLTNKAFQLLCFFAKHPNRLITKDEILENLWPDVYVSEGVIKEYVHDLRVAFSDDVKQPTFIETVRGRGYRFLGDVELIDVGAIKAAAGTPSAVSQPEPTIPSIDGLPSIAVLPLENLRGDTNDNYLARGIAEDIIVSLAQLRELVVIAHAATLSYDTKHPDPQEVGRSLRVQYLLRGSLRRSNRVIVVSVQLLETERNQAIYADRFESPLDGIFDIQDEIVERVITHIAPTVWKQALRQVLRKRPSTYSAFDYTLRAIDVINNLGFDTFVLAGQFLDNAIAADPGFAMAFAWAARWRSIKIGQGWSDNPTKDAKDAERLVKRAMELDPQNALAAAVRGHILSFLFHDYETAIVYLERARQLSPSNALAWVASSATESYLGRGEEAIRMAERGLRLSPKGSGIFYIYHFLAIAHYVAGNYEDALKWARLSDMENPVFSSNVRLLCNILPAVGRIQDAHEMADRLLKIEPDFTLSYYEQKRLPYKAAHIRSRAMRHLFLAGLPE
jgi:TolB-like protein